MAITEIASGVGGQLVAQQETTFGVAPALTGAGLRSLEFNSETLKLKKNTVQGRGLHAGGRFDRGKRRIVASYEAGGGIDMDLQTRNLNLLLRAMMGSFDTSVYASNGTLVTNGESPTATYTAVHIPGSNIGASLTLQVGRPTLDGVIVPFTYTGGKVTDWTISVAVDQIAKLATTWDFRSELAAPALSGGNPSVPATTIPYVSTFGVPAQVVITGGTMTAVIINGVTVGAGAGTYVVPAGGVISLTYTVAPTWAWTPAPLTGDPLNTSIPALASWTDVQTDVFHFREAQLITGGTVTTTSNVSSVAGGTSNTNVKDCSVKVMNPVNAKRFNLTSSGFKSEQVDNGFRQITGSFEIEWLSNETMYAAYAQDVPTALQLNFVGANIGSGSHVETLNILIPYIKLDGEAPSVGGPDIVTEKVTFTGLDDEVNNPIQITYTTLDSAS